MLQAKFGVTDLDAKQRLFRLIKRINADDSCIDTREFSSDPTASGQTSAARVRISEQNGNGDGGSLDVTALTCSLRAMNNNLLDLNSVDSSDGFLTGVRPPELALPIRAQSIGGAQDCE